MDELLIKQKKLGEQIASLINSANLPAFIIKPVIKDLFDQLDKIEEEQYRQALIAQKSKEINEKRQEENKEKKEKEEEK